jgi:hypothetical protein
MQAALAFRWRRTFEQGARICEWFQIPGLTEAAIISVLDEVYELVPADLTDSAVVLEPSVPQPHTAGGQLPMF